MRNKLFSIFIMDVTDSSKFENYQQLSQYLSFWEQTLNDFSSNIQIKAKYRMGDEIICVAEHYFSAYLLANHLLSQWKFREAMPYFGIALGEFEKDIGEIGELESWNHPSIKIAREKTEAIKTGDRQSYFAMSMSDFSMLSKTSMNTEMEFLFHLQSLLINEQSNSQREVYSLYSLLDKQQLVAEELNKTQATVSAGYNRGKSDLLAETSNLLLEKLETLEAYQQLALLHRPSADVSDKQILSRQFLHEPEKTEETIFENRQKIHSTRENWEINFKHHLFQRFKKYPEVRPWEI
ncbi:hypothetical protein ACWN8V_01170 [Vagococcus elongatus]|uniref:Uncharacterized protein n=1 Tax=Vagococcus elongatus TaxID=180344 RepID=A0A430B5X3_9ENTE|nr:hypothetical protein [Vagococcus elongatus]RSU15710.1 hypothetical protein CBF29_01155 [Vagococcus elongatus]